MTKALNDDEAIHISDNYNSVFDYLTDFMMHPNKRYREFLLIGGKRSDLINILEEIGKCETRPMDKTFLLNAVIHYQRAKNKWRTEVQVFFEHLLKFENQYPEIQFSSHPTFEKLYNQYEENISKHSVRTSKVREKLDSIIEDVKKADFYKVLMKIDEGLSNFIQEKKNQGIDSDTEQVLKLYKKIGVI